MRSNAFKLFLFLFLIIGLECNGQSGTSLVPQPMGGYGAYLPPYRLSPNQPPPPAEADVLLPKLMVVPPTPPLLCPIPAAAAANITAGDNRCTRCASDSTLWLEDPLCVVSPPLRMCSFSGATGLLASSPLCLRCANPPASFTSRPSDSLGLWAGDPTCPTASTIPCPFRGLPPGVTIGDIRCVEQEPVVPLPNPNGIFELECDCANAEDHYPKEMTLGVKACFGITTNRKPTKAYCRLKAPDQGNVLGITKSQLLANVQRIEWNQTKGSSSVSTGIPSVSGLVLPTIPETSISRQTFSVTERTNHAESIKDQVTFEFPVATATIGSGKISDNFAFKAVAKDASGTPVWVALGSIDMVMGVQGGGCGSCSLSGTSSVQNILANFLVVFSIAGFPFFRKRIFLKR